MSGIRKLVVAGGDSIAWTAACSMARAFRHLALEVTLVDVGLPEDAPATRWTLPSQRALNMLLGVAEPELMVRTGATYRLATEHAEWQGKGSRFLHAHGEIGRELGGVPFYRYLLREALALRHESPTNYSLAALAALAGRFARPMGDAGSLTQSFTYGFHLDEAPFAGFMREHAVKLGVGIFAGRLGAVERGDGGRITALTLADGTRVPGDFFLDCTGRGAVLLHAVDGGARIDWSSWLPCDRRIEARLPPAESPPALTRTTATRAGWRWRLPLASETRVGCVYSSAYTDEAAARAELLAAEPGAQPLTGVAQINAGRRASFWEHNCVAIGPAAVELEPLVGAELHYAQLGVSTLIELFPLDDVGAVERVEYNRLMVERVDALRDFTLAHYLVGAQRDGELWRAVRSVAPPVRLAHKLDLFRAGGRIELLDFETFEETDWAWLLLGAGCRPDSLEQSVSLALERVDAREFASLRAQLRELAASMPPHIEYVRRLAELAGRGAR